MEIKEVRVSPYLYRDVGGLSEKLRRETSLGFQQAIIAAFDPKTNQFDAGKMLELPPKPKTTDHPVPAKNQAEAYLEAAKGERVNPYQLLNQLSLVTQEQFEARLIRGGLDEKGTYLYPDEYQAFATLAKVAPRIPATRGSSWIHSGDCMEKAAETQ